MISIPEDVKYILKKINESGFEAFIVGGCVRDSIMGKEPMDWDIATSALPEDISGIFSKTFETGIEHGTLVVVVNNNNYEVTTYRIDGIYEDNRRPKDVVFTNNICEDLSRRDFTINAIAYSERDEYIDPFGGAEDIEMKIIRGVGQPDKRFKEDALRMMRCIRFSAQLDFDIEKETYEALIDNAPLIKNISAERVRDEFTKLLVSNNPEKLVLFLDTEILLNYKEDFHNYLLENKEWITSLIKQVDNNKLIRYAVLLMNMEDGEVISFFKSLNFDNKTMKTVKELISGIKYAIKPDGYSVRKFISIFGYDNGEIIIELKRIINIYYNRFDIEEYNFIKSEFYLTKEKGSCVTVRELDINGRDVQDNCLVEGKYVGQILEYLLDVVLHDPEKNSREELLYIAKNMVK